MAFTQLQPRIMWGPKPFLNHSLWFKPAKYIVTTTTAAAVTTFTDEDGEMPGLSKYDSLDSAPFNAILDSMNFDRFAYLSVGEGPNLILIAVYLVGTILSLFLNIFFFFWTIKGIYVNTNGSLVSSFQWICLSQVRINLIFIVCVCHEWQSTAQSTLSNCTRFCLTYSASLSTSMSWSGL